MQFIRVFENEDQIENERSIAIEVNPTKEKIMTSKIENVECQIITNNEEKIIDVDENNMYTNCKNCNWTGKRNALMKHLRMKSLYTSKYDMKRLHKKLREKTLRQNAIC